MRNYLDILAGAYYKGHPIVTDNEWDYLAKIHNYNEVGAKVDEKSKRVQHFHRLYSLQKYYENDTLPFGVYTEKRGVVISPKLDGSAISLTYISGELTYALTRGDGIIGEDVTNNFKAWDKIPNNILWSGIVQIVGEIVAPKKIKNSRNYAAGAARLKDPKEFISRDIAFVTYALYLPDISKNKTYLDDLVELTKLGFLTVLEDDLVEEYPTDGLVYRINDHLDYERAGYTDRHPKGAFALKHTDDVEKVHTELLEVIWQVGKSGKVTPVAIFNEIEIEGAKINKATLHNAGFIEDLELAIGDTIIVTRAGGIIPKVLGVV